MAMITAVSKDERVARDDERGGAPDWLDEVLDRHFLPRVPAPGEVDGGESDPDVSRVLRALGFAEEFSLAQERGARHAVEAALRAGVHPNQAFALAQAYARGIGRIAAAEIEVLRRRLRDVEPERRKQDLDTYLAATNPLTTQLFTAIHAEALREGLRDALHPDHIDEPNVAVRAVGLVDLVESTQLLHGASAKQTVDAVDALYEAGLECIRGRNVHVVKYVGDGVFLIGRDTVPVAEAALDAVRQLLPMAPRGIRGGLARGPVVRRAGDYFGLAVNLSARLAALAETGTVLIEASALPEGCGDGLPRIRHEVRGVSHPVECVVMSVDDA
jgi:class 3 adenylate cyclase